MSTTALDLICTLGPSTFAPEILTQLIGLGVVNFRLPFSKESPDLQKQRIETILRVARDRPVNMIMDLPGSKVRLDNPYPVTIRAGQEYRVYYTTDATTFDEAAHSFGLTAFPQDTRVKPGATFFSGDGEFAFHIQHVAIDHCIAVAQQTGQMGPRRGIAFAGSSAMPLAALTERDIDYLTFLDTGLIDALMLSFIEHPQDIQHIVSIATQYSHKPLAIYAKIETATGIKHLQEIANVSDFLVLGRGDLLLNVGMVDFCMAQEKFSTSGIPKEKLVIATQLFNGLSESALPNRSELTAFYQFVRSGLSKYMLSFETTIGKSPVRTIETMQSLYHAWSR